MTIGSALAALLMATSPAVSPAASASDASGCPKICESKAVPCSGKHEDGQMMCVEIVKRCEIRCDAKPDAAKRSARRSSER